MYDLESFSKIVLKDNYLIVEFFQPQQVLSWAILNGYKVKSKRVVWFQVKDEDLDESVDPNMFIQKKFRGTEMLDSVGLLTSATIKNYVDVNKTINGKSARCIATVGLSNALRVGDAPGEQINKKTGTINILVHLSTPLSNEAFVEAISIATEARTTAVLESKYPSIQSSLAASGTGTDCIVVAAPDYGPFNNYSGKHTEIGYLIGSTVYEAMVKGIKKYTKEL